MPIYRSTVVIGSGTGLPEDAMTNTFHFRIEPPQDPVLVRPILTDALRQFYMGCHNAAGFANYYQWTSARVDWYNLSDPPPRVPTSIALGLTGIPVAASSFPSEVSIVSSFQGVRQSGVPQARRRGRVYLGGFVFMTVNSLVGTPPRLDPAIINQIVAASEELRDDSATASAPWVVWSPTDNNAVEVTNGWVDNAPDTQRRRGQAATTRTTWS